ncbi:MAG TPA: hypothetical protein EYQ68_07970 [Cytophagales bacterium]|nr:hypothetical protein [Cytophagales bacterium]
MRNWLHYLYKLRVLFCKCRMTVSKRNWMQGPPDKESTIRFADGSFYCWPQLKWSFNNIQQLVPTKTVWRGANIASQIIENNKTFETLTIGGNQAESLTWSQVLEETQTDGLAIMHNGQLVYESYHHHGSQHKPHLIMSCAKSMVGLLAEMMIVNGELDDTILVTTHLPELEHCAWSNATVRDVLDMQIAMDFDENYLNPDSEVCDTLEVVGCCHSYRARQNV